MQRFLQEADRWRTKESWLPPRLLEANGSTRQHFGRSQRPGNASSVLEGVTGLMEVAGFRLRLAQSQQQRTTLGIVHRFLALQGLACHVIKAHCLGIGWQCHVALPGPYGG